MQTTTHVVSHVYTNTLLPIGLATAPVRDLGWPVSVEKKGKDRALAVALSLASYAAAQAGETEIADLLTQIEEGKATALHVCATGRSDDISTLESCADMLRELAEKIASGWDEEIAAAEYPARLEDA